MTTHYRIHPSIGIARMGNSPDHFVGPETPGVPPNWNSDKQAFNSFRDAKGRILRQGARFRVFAYDEDVNGVLSNPREVAIGEGDITDIEWRVHVANRKASFFVFYGQFGADDLYVARASLPPDKIIKTEPDRANLRNPDVPKAERSQRLDIDPGEKLISQTRSSAVELSNPNSAIPIASLGTLRLDEKGRLIVLGGYGESNSTEKPPRQIDEYASNDTWFDDAGDGSVKARVRLKDGTFVDADAAWVFVGPPDFAPGIGNVVTLQDTLWDTAVREVDFLPSTPSTPMLALLREQKQVWQASDAKSLAGFKPSFIRDIYPVLRRAMGAPDIHVSGVANPHYHRVLLGDWALLSTLSGPRAAEAARLRAGIINWIRDPDDSRVQWKKMPRGLGDLYTDLDNGTPKPQSFLTLTRIQFALLREWAAANFNNDWPGSEPLLTATPNPTPDDLDRASVENSVGGPFYPGIDVSWLVRQKDLFAEPLRLKVAREPEADKASAPLTIGALEFRPGYFSQQMALPWQADFYDCHKEEFNDPDGNQYHFMWWTAHRPDDVFPSGSDQRARWVREFDKHAKDPDDPDNLDNLERFSQMQSNWHKLKFVSAKNGDHYEEESDFNAS
jgi:hypothetical protein